jgi:hypothetical protein
MKMVSILDMPKDLLDEDRSDLRSKSQAAKLWNMRCQRGQLSGKSTLDVLVTEVANTLEIAPQELHDWTQEPLVPEAILKLILITAKRLKLSPLLGQIDWEQNPEGGYEIYIPIDGWISLIQQQPTFQGITFNQSSETENGIPSWMECTLYRSDLTHPITVREYFVELKTEHPMWQQMPRRMLRHKTLQQCARLAFGISVAELDKTKPQIIKTKFNPSNQKNTTCSGKNLLKEKLRIS